MLQIFKPDPLWKPAIDIVNKPLNDFNSIELNIGVENFTFRKECLEKYDLEIYENIMEMFDSLPLVCIVNDLYFCVHGGISPELRELADINTKINRF